MRVLGENSGGEAKRATWMVFDERRKANPHAVLAVERVARHPANIAEAKRSSRTRYVTLSLWLVPGEHTT